MSDTTLLITIKVPVPTSRIDQAKILLSLSEPLDTFKKALPKTATVEDKVVTARPPKPARPAVVAHQHAAE